MYIRHAEYKDVDEIEKIYTDARAYMRGAGNMHQWSGGYPSRADIEADIKDNTLYTAVENGKILAVFCCMDRPEPTYDKIYNGGWIDEGEYRAVHRIAVAKDQHGRGVAACCFDFAMSYCGSVKIDTHRDNIPMQKTLLKNGFQYCGIIYLKNGEERLAYQKKSEKTECKELVAVFDALGMLTDKSVRRDHIFSGDEYRRVVHIVILNDKGEMLIQQRQFFKNGWPGMWDVTVGGSTLAGETGCRAAQRELYEELGISVELTGKRPDITFSFDHGFDDFFILKSNVDISKLSLQPEEVRAVEWASCDRILDMMDKKAFIPYKPELIRLLFCFDRPGVLGRPQL